MNSQLCSLPAQYLSLMCNVKWRNFPLFMMVTGRTFIAIFIHHITVNTDPGALGSGDVRHFTGCC